MHFFSSSVTGASRIMEACKAQNVPEPTWSINGGFICVTFVRPITDPMKTPVGLQLGLSSEQVGPKLDSSLYQVRTKHPTSSPQVPHKFPLSSPQVLQLIEVMDEDYMSASNIMQKMELADRKNFNLLYLMPALANCIIERKYPDTPNHPRQQYKLTEQALEWKRGQK